ncbi:MAG: hypothetical protein AMJ62_14765 [Myxococcales bacterium SG8_38]|nr:MAG: hypothetical protein AMJ62_14765 [Myxococcales bacterium SG8_38]
MSCPTELTLSIHADGELPEEEIHRVAAHLEGCADCRALAASLERENEVLREVLGEEEAMPLSPPAGSLAAGSHATSSSTSASRWVYGAIASAALAPLMLDFAWRATPSLPAGLGWLGNLGGAGGVFSLSRVLVELTVGGEDMLISSFGFAVTLFFVIGSIGVVALRRPAVGAAAGVALALLASLAPPSPVHAAELRFEKEGTVKVDAGESIDDTVFLSGKTAIVAGTVQGDVFAAAERVEITGTVHGNVYGVGQSVTITGEVGGNVHAAGKTVEVDTRVGGSGFLAGQNVILTEGSELSYGGFLAGETVRAKGRISRDAYFAAETMEISGSVERTVRGYAGQLSVSSSASIGGDIEVTVPAEDAAQIDEGATVNGATVIDVDAKHEHRAFLYPGFYFGVLAKALALLLLGVLAVTLFPSLRPPVPESGKEVLREMAIGFVILLATPVAMVLVALTVIGIPIAIVTGMAYAVLLYASTLAVAYFAAQRLPAALDNRRLVLRTGLSLLVVLFVLEVPLVGPGLSFLVHIFGVGCLVMHLRELYLASRGPTSSVAGQPGALAT